MHQGVTLPVLLCRCCAPRCLVEGRETGKGGGLEVASLSCMFANDSKCLPEGPLFRAILEKIR